MVIFQNRLSLKRLIRRRNVKSSLCTFMDIFSKEVDCGDGKKICPKKIIIPIIQRDYAQGRDSVGIGRVRSKFLDALYKAVTENPVTLDFIYGDIDDDGILTPLDGQQRLTTLFLMHWYAAKKENISSDESVFLKKFSYEIRPDARDFCKFLVEFQPSFDEENLSSEIENQSWFPLNWRKDPTVDSMLRMLNAIEKKFCDVPNLWEKLEGGAISFHFLSIKNIGLTDELYITMNSRGKPLTDFEHFKAEFKRKLDELDENISHRIILKIDTKWTDLLWKFRDKNKSNPIVDDMFLNYFRFICDILRYKRGGTSQGKSYDEFVLLEEFFSAGNIYDNIDFLEKSFDCWCEIDDIENFFDERVSLGDRNKRDVNKHQRGKIITYYDNQNFLKKCLKVYGATKDGRTRKFALGETIMLYAFLVYLLNKEKVSDEDFRRRIRTVNNLVSNSEGAEISDSESRQGGNRLPAILKQVDNIILYERIVIARGTPNFNVYQLEEECKKIIWTAQNPDKAELLFELEDHYLLYGQIGILELKNLGYFKRFISLFNCDYDKINCALITRGDYFATDKDGLRFQFGSPRIQSWQSIFHNSLLQKREYTQENLLKLLDMTETFNDAFLDKIISEYLTDCEKNKSFEWSYYYIKYPVFRPKSYGKYDWKNFDDEPYKFIALLTRDKWSQNAYQPFLKAIVDEKFFQEHYNPYNERLEFENRYGITCENSSYVIMDFITNEIIDELSIEQNKSGIDIEDRIKKFDNWEGKDILI